MEWLGSDVRFPNRFENKDETLGDDFLEIGRFDASGLYSPSGIAITSAVQTFLTADDHRYFHVRLRFDRCTNADQTVDFTELATGRGREGRARVVQRGVDPELPEGERDALVDLFDATNGPGWTDSDSWLGPPGTECSWFGITCEGDHVVEIALAFNGLERSLPESLGDLERLKRLNLPANRLGGSLPASITELRALQELDLAFNAFTGTPVSGWDALTDLVELRLSDNELTGDIAPLLDELAQLPRLGSLSLDGNAFSGSLPQAVGDLEQLSRLDLSENRLVGAIPETMTTLSRVRFLDLHGNRLTGELPENLGNMASLFVLDASENDLEGRIPKSVKELGFLRHLRLSQNHLSDLIPCELAGLEGLTRIELEQNRLQGSIPPSLGKLPKLEVLTLAHNDLGGQVPRSLLLLEELETVSLAHNGLDTSAEADLRRFIEEREEGPSWLTTQGAAAPLGPNQTVRNWQNQTGISHFLVSLKSAWFGSPGRVVFRIRRVFACLPPTDAVLAGRTSADPDDVALLARWGAPPTLEEYDYISSPSGEFEEIVVEGPREGDLYLGVYSAQPNTETEIETIAPGMPEEVPPVPHGPFLDTSEIPGFRFKVRIDGGVPGAREDECIEETLCVSGALPGRSELFLRTIGPRPNGFLWLNLVRFTPSEIEVWVEQKSTGELNYYRLDPLPRSSDRLLGLVDKEAFSPAEEWSEGGLDGRTAHLEPASRPLGDAVEFVPPEFLDYRFTVRILAGGEEIPTRRESRCIPETVCVSGAVPGRSELFLRIIGPRPNNFFHVNVVRFTPSRVEVTIERLSTEEVRHYVLEATPRESDVLDGRLDRTAFGAGVH